MLRPAEAVTATVAGWIVNPDTAVPESRAMMVGFSMVLKITVLYGMLACLTVSVACATLCKDFDRAVECFPRQEEKSLNFDG